MEVDRQYTLPEEVSEEEGLDEGEDYEGSEGYYGGTSQGSPAGSLRKVSDGLKLSKVKSIQKSKGHLSAGADDPLVQTTEDPVLSDNDDPLNEVDHLVIDTKFTDVEREVEAQIAKTDHLLEEKLNAKNKKKK